MFLRDANQTLLIRFTALEDEGFYVCNASNRIGSAVSTNTLILTGMLYMLYVYIGILVLLKLKFIHKTCTHRLNIVILHCDSG